MVGLSNVLRRIFGSSSTRSAARERKPTLGDCEMREYSRHAGLRHRWIDIY